MSFKVGDQVKLTDWKESFFDWYSVKENKWVISIIYKNGQMRLKGLLGPTFNERQLTYYIEENL